MARYQAAGYTLGEYTMAPTTPMCPPQGAPTYIVPRNTITLRESLGWTQGECGSPSKEPAMPVDKAISGKGTGGAGDRAGIAVLLR